jgi:glycerate-2-kinase
LDAAATLAANDSTPFFEALDDLIVTGPTGTNVMDVQVVLIPE